MLYRQNCTVVLCAGLYFVFVDRFGPIRDCSCGIGVYRAGFGQVFSISMRLGVNAAQGLVSFNVDWAESCSDFANCSIFAVIIDCVIVVLGTEFSRARDEICGHFSVLQ